MAYVSSLYRARIGCLLSDSSYGTFSHTAVVCQRDNPGLMCSSDKFGGLLVGAGACGDESTYPRPATAPNSRSPVATAPRSTKLADAIRARTPQIPHETSMHSAKAPSIKPARGL